MVLHLTMNSFQHGSRILKECSTSLKLGWDKPVMVAALHDPGLEQEENLDGGVAVWRVVLKTRGWPRNVAVQLIKYLEWAGRILFRMRKQDLTVIHAHNISTLPIAVVLKWLTGAPVIYDAHELESRTNGLSSSRSKVIRFIESRWIRGADWTITVCDSIADWYENEYSMVRPIVIRNVPMRSAAPSKKTTLLRDIHDIPSDAILYLYQGLMSPGRGIEALLEVFSGLKSDKHIVLMGYGALEEQVLNAATTNANIHFQSAASPDRVLQFTASADVGVCLIEDCSLSDYYSLPNKLFEYLLSGLPVLVNDMPEQRKIVENFDCGWVFPLMQEDQQVLFESIAMKEISERGKGAVMAAKTIDWVKEAEPLENLYTEISGHDVSRPKPATAASPNR